MLSTGQGSGKGERVELNYYWQKKLFILLRVRTFVIKVNKYLSQLLS